MGEETVEANEKDWNKKHYFDSRRNLSAAGSRIFYKAEQSCKIQR